MVSRPKVFLLISGIVFFLWFWEHPFLLPIKLFIVLIHELCHAGAALLLGGRVDSIILHLDETGITQAVTSMDNRFVLMVSAGYLGSTLIGAFLLNRALKGRWIGFSLSLLGVFVSGLSGYLLVRYFQADVANQQEHGFLTAMFGLTWGIFFLLSAWFGKKIGRPVLFLIGSLSVLYCVFDFGDFIRGVETTDAGILAAYLLKRPWPQAAGEEAVRQAATLISILWVLLSLFVLWLLLHPALREGGAPTSESPDQAHPPGPENWQDPRLAAGQWNEPYPGYPPGGDPRYFGQPESGFGDPNQMMAPGEMNDGYWPSSEGGTWPPPGDRRQPPFPPNGPYWH